MNFLEKSNKMLKLKNFRKKKAVFAAFFFYSFAV